MVSFILHAEENWFFSLNFYFSGEYTYWGNDDVDQPPSKLENQKLFSLPRLPYKYDSLNIETTAYALLTYASRQELLVDSIVRWLNAQRLTDGGWASTQDTGMAIKALIEYTQRTRIRDVSTLSVTVEATSLPGQTKYIQIGEKNLAYLQSIDVSLNKKSLKKYSNTTIFVDSKCLGYRQSSS